MAIKITYDDGVSRNIEDYSVSEDSSPIDPSDQTGGVGQFTLNVGDEDFKRSLILKTVELSDGSQGTTTGIASGSATTDGAPVLTVDSRLNVLTAIRTAQPFNGTLGAAFTYYVGLVGITSGLVVDSTITSRAVVFQGWTGVVWDELRQMCSALGVEISLVSDNVVLRPIRGRIAQNYRDSSHGETIDTSSLSQSIEIYYYNSTHQVNALAYPDGGWNTDVPVQSGIAAGSTTLVPITFSASLSSIQQPTCVDFVDQFYSASSVYTVTGGDNLPVTAAEWIAEGGSVTVELNDDTVSATVTIIASPNTENGPYTIAMTAGASSNYSSLRLVGTGTFSNKQMLTLSSSVDPLTVSTVIGSAIDNPYINTIDDAYHAGLWALKSWGSPRYTINISSTGINRIGDTGSYAYPTIAQFDAAMAGMTVAQFNTLWSGKTIQQFNDYWNATVSGAFANQAFGNVAGARVRFGDAMFRIRSAGIGPAGLTYTAQEDTTVADFDAVWAGATVAQFNAEWSTSRWIDFALAPLRRSS
jgi:hypothetical protein